MLFYCIYLSFSSTYISFFLKIFNCAVRSEQNVTNKNVSSVSTDTIAFAGKICQSLLNFPANSISPVNTIYTLLYDAFGSNSNPCIKILKYVFHF